MQAFQVFHETTAKASDLCHYKQRDKEPLANFMKRFMQQKSQTSRANDKTTIQVLICGFTLGQISHLSREEPKTIKELFDELEKYTKSDEDHGRRFVERN
jgi:hypothetical protein